MRISLSRLVAENSGCPDGCGYSRDGDTESEVWCFVEGPYTPDYSCPSTSSSPSPSSSLTSSSPSSVCGPGQSHHAGRCYGVSEAAVSWGEAKLRCEAACSSLATVTSAQESAFIQQLLEAEAEDAWIGLNDVASQGSYVWADGTSLGAVLEWRQ